MKQPLKTYLKVGINLLLLGWIAIAVADDTEIYFVSGGDLGTEPQVMFNLEYTPSMGSTICTGVTWENFATQCSKIYPIRHYLAPGDMPNDILSLESRTLNQFQLTRAALKRVLAPLGNLKVGIMSSHAHNSNCVGPSAVQCSNGGLVLQRMVELAPAPTGFNAASASRDQIDAMLALDSGKAELFSKLDAMPSPSGNLSNPSQLKEIYFEMFRYLTGQGIFNGHNGWNDFGTGPNSQTNVGDWEYRTTPPNNAQQRWDYRCETGYTCGDETTGPLPGGRYVKSGGVDADYRYNGDFIAVGNPVTHYLSSYPFKWDSLAEDGANYISPLEHCSKVFVVNVLDGGGTQQNDSDSDIAKPLSQGGMNFTPSNNDPGFVQMVRWLYNKDLADGTINNLDLLDIQNVTSFFIAKQPQQLDAAAVAGGTGSAIRLTDDAESVVEAIEAIFNQILSVSSTFVSASIPVNVFNRSEVLDNAYIALFQADSGARPNWPGNIKKLKLDIYQICVQTDAITGECLETENRLRLIDARGEPAIADLDGRIHANSLTFWTKENGYDLTDDLDDHEVLGRDGRSVHRGGAGQNIPGFLTGMGTQGTVSWSNIPGGRTLYTESDGTRQPLHWGNIGSLWPSVYNGNLSGLWPQTYDALGNEAPVSGNWLTDKELYTQDPTDVTIVGTQVSFRSGGTATLTTVNSREFKLEDLVSNIFAHMRGFDVTDQDGDGVRWESRRWLFGDPLHSRPLPVNYGARPDSGHTMDNPDIRILVGSNDGYLRMIRNTNPDGSESGEEVWAFMPRSVMGIQKQLMLNASGGNPVHPYAVDGPVTAFVQDNDGNIGSNEDNDKAWVFFGLRRGGQSYYALDITDPDNPRFMWEISNATPGFADMGYTFSQPVVRIVDWGEGPKPAVIVGGGYDRLNKDNNINIGSNDTIGNAIYIINAESGELVWKVTGTGTASANVKIHADMVDSIPSELTVIDSNGDGLADRIYVGDTGGDVWRVDMVGIDRNNWNAHRIMSLGRHYSNTLANDRRFFHAPDVVYARDHAGVFYGVVIGSGNRANPLQNHVNDALFMYKDRGNVPTSPISPDELFDATNNCVQQDGETCYSGYLDDLNSGWMIYLTDNGEKSLSTPLTLRGVVYFNSYVPVTSSSEPESCGPAEGTGYLYAISLTDARAVIDYDATNNFVTEDGKEIILQVEDRRRRLRSGGIPSENQFVSYTDADGNTINTVLPPDFASEEDLGAQNWRTYWFERNR